MSINNYEPYPGFYDLREYILNKTLFKKLWKIQDALFNMQSKAVYYKKWHPNQWEKAKQISGEYQQILFHQSYIK